MPHFRSKPVEGEFIRYDGSNGEKVADFAGEQHEGPDGGGHPVIRSLDGDHHPLRPGWVLSRVPGRGGVGIHSTQAWDTWAEEIS